MIANKTTAASSERGKTIIIVKAYKIIVIKNTNKNIHIKIKD